MNQEIETNKEIESISDKNLWVYFVLLLFFGGLGIHRFYLGKNTSGVLYLLTGGVLGIGAAIDILALLFTGNETPLCDGKKQKLKSKIGVRLLCLTYLVGCGFLVYWYINLNVCSYIGSSFIETFFTCLFPFL